LFARPQIVNTPTPALVPQRAAARLPRLPLLLLCAAWVLPGVIGRDPWRNADLTAFGVMSAMAEGRTSWLAPTLGSVPVDAAPLAHWLGAASIVAFSPLLDGALAARLPFALLLALTLALTWYAAFHLARTEAAQPLAFAFGGEADTVDYARALADGALLALLAMLGLLQLGHETTPELVQFFGAALFLWALAAAPFRRARARVGVVAALAVLATGGGPAMAVGMGALGTLACLRSAYAQARGFAPWVAGATVLAAALAGLAGTWAWHAGFEPDAEQLGQLLRQWAWFMWPAWPLVLWTLWQWRRQWTHRHVFVPASVAAVALFANVFMGGSDRALLLGLPALAVLAAFALPTLRRSVSAAIDWFSMCFFSVCALFVWAMYVAIQTGSPARWAANVARLAPGFEPAFAALPLVLALAGTLAWMALVRWRTGRHRHALWKSLVIPAGGVALCWLLLMTLWLPLLDYARSPRAVVERVQALVGPAPCVATPGFSPVMVAQFETLGRMRVDARADSATRCPVLLAVTRQVAPPTPAGWTRVGSARRPTDRAEIFTVFRR
jgi:4-amino-4-deoxy-L-arabinose transferase-like glycosyltransferase